MRMAHGCVEDGNVLVPGGDDATGIGLATAELFDPSNESFAPMVSMSTRRRLRKATLLNDGTVRVTGDNGSGGARTFATAELYQ
jgi:hypothetical protein